MLRTIHKRLGPPRKCIRRVRLSSATTLAESARPAEASHDTRTIVTTPQPPATGWQTIAYAYSANHPHAVESAGADTYSYDENGNMTCRVEDGISYAQSYNAENRLSVVTRLLEGTCASPVKTDVQWDFTYDGDGTRAGTVLTTFDPDTQAITGTSITAYFMGGLYEETDGVARKYYAVAGMTLAVSDATGTKFLLTDHLGSVAAVTDSAGALLDQQRYMPFGKVRPNVGTITQTDFGYTGQRDLSLMGLMDYKARFYDAYLNRWTQPDSIVPDAFNPQALDRYAYVLNNPVRYTDPTGHAYCPYSECDIVVNAHTEKMQLRGNLRNGAEGLVRDLGGINDLEAMTSIVAAGASAYRNWDRLLPQLSNIFIGVPNSGPGTLVSASGAAAVLEWGGSSTTAPRIPAGSSIQDFIPISGIDTISCSTCGATSPTPHPREIHSWAA